MARRGLSIGVGVCAAAAAAMLTAAAATAFLSIHASTPAGEFSLEGGALKVGKALGPMGDVTVMDPLPVSRWPVIPTLEPWTFSTPYARTTGTTMVLPLWLPAAASGLLGLWFWLRLRAALREESGRCRACGYSLRGIPGNDPCPECGTLRRNPTPS